MELYAPLWARALLGLGLGVIVGSFLATIASRWPAGRSSLRGRSRCDACGVSLGPRELIPILSYFLQRGRCRRCGGGIHPRHVLVELTAGSIGLLAFAGSADLPVMLAGAWLGWLLLLLSILDLEHFWLPDRLNFLLFASGILAALGELGPSMQHALIGTAAGFAGLWLIGAFYANARGREGLGAGDPKLFGAIGAWLGWQLLPFVLLAAGLLGLAVVLAMALAGRTTSLEQRLPLGTLLAAAAFPTWLLTYGSFAPRFT